MNKQTLVYVVVYGNYEPCEVDRIYSTRKAAEARAEALGDMWQVTAWEVIDE